MAIKKVTINQVVDASGNLDEFLPSTSADIVSITDAGNKFNSDNVEGALAELATSVASAGKVDDVQGADGNSVVENKVAKLSKSAVGLGNVDNTADGEKSVKYATNAGEAVKVSSKLALKSTATSGAEYDGSMPVALAFKDDEFSVSQSSVNGTATVTVGLKEDYVTSTEMATELGKKLDVAGGTITGDLVIGGGLTVNGPTTTIESETLQVTDKLIEVAKGNTTALASPAGLVAKKSDGTNDVAIVVNSEKMAQVGKVAYDANGNIDVANSELQTLATRTGLTDGSLVKYDGTNKTLVNDTRDFAETNVNETITGDWTFDHANGFRTNAIENKNGNRVYDYDGTNNRFGSLSNPTHIRGSEVRPKYFADGDTTGKDIMLADDTAGNATNVTTSIGGKAITDIFENGSTTVKKATLAETANAANKVANVLTVSGQNDSGTEQSVTYNGSAPKALDFDGNDFAVTSDGTNFDVSLADSGVSSGVYTAVQVTEKGIATAGGQAFAFINEGDAVPSNVIVGGLIFEIIG